MKKLLHRSPYWIRTSEYSSQSAAPYLLANGLYILKAPSATDLKLSGQLMCDYCNVAFLIFYVIINIYRFINLLPSQTRLNRF